jgi:hypothetical protein
MRFKTMMAVGAGFVLSAGAESVTNNLNLNKGIIYNHGAVKPDEAGLTFTNAGIRDVTVSAGQLSGVDPEDGSVITNAANLLPLKVQSLETSGDVLVGGSLSGDAAGLTGLDVESAVAAGSISGDKLAAGAVTAEKIAAGAVLSAQIASGAVQESHLGFNPKSVAGGEQGSFQFNQNGQLAGFEDFFIHEETGKPAFLARTENLMRFYKTAEVSDENLIYALRRFDDTTEICLFQNGAETLRLRGDGSIYATGALEVGGLSLGGGGTSGSTGWFIPEEGDLSMGTFTQE